MYANWQGNFIEVSQYFISQQQTEKLILNENATRKVGYFGKEHQSSRVYRIFDKSITLSAQGNQTGFYLFKCRTPNKENVRGDGRRFGEGDKFYTLTTVDRHGILAYPYIRRLHPVECERLQTLDDGYSDGISDNQRYRCLGNGWTVDVIAHLLSYMKD